MNQKKFIELRKAKGLVLLSGTTIAILYITKDFVLIPEILMVFLGLAALIRAKFFGINFSEKRAEIRKGVYFSLIALLSGFLIKLFSKKFLFELNFVVELILVAMIFVLLKEVYSEKKNKWINAFVLIGIFLIASGAILLLFSLAERFIV